jgi:ATP:ADP antiporter, AAA family
MTHGWTYRFLRRFTDARPEESALTIRLYLYFFLMMAASGMILPLKTSLFLRRLPPERLPIAYLVTAVLMSFVAVLNSRLVQRLNRQRYVSLSLIFFICSLLVFRILFQNPPAWVTIAFWFWAEAFLAISVMQFYILVYDLYSPRQAKRFVGFFVGGGLLGGLTGSLVTLILSRLIGSVNLLLICPGLLAVGLMLIGRVHRIAAASAGPPAPKGGGAPRPPAREKVGYVQSLRTLLQSRYLVLLSGIMLATFAVSKLIDWQFSKELSLAFPNDDQRTAFLGAFQMALFFVSYLLQILLTGRILKKFGLRTALFVAPVVLAFGAASGIALGFLLPGALMVWATLMRGTDKSLSLSLSQSTREVLYIPVPPETRAKAKVFIDLFVNKFADVVASILILIFAIWLGWTVPELSLLTLGIILIWAVLNHRITREYIGIVKKNLTIKWPDADKYVLEHVDLDATKLVFDTLESRNRSSVLYAMNLMDLVQRDKLSPELRKIIGEHASEVRAGSFDTLLDVAGTKLVPEMDDVLEERDFGAEVREVLSLDVYQQLMREHIEKSTEHPGPGSALAQMEIAKALGMMSADSPLVKNLAKLLRSNSPEVVGYALESAGRQRKREFVPLIVPHLGRPGTAEAAAGALLEYGDRIAGMLKDYLADPAEESAVRKAIPAILARMGTPRAAAILVHELKAREAAVSAEIIAALDKLRSAQPDIPFAAADIQPEIFNLVAKACGLVQELALVHQKGRPAASAGDFEALFARTLQQIFSLVGLLYSRDDVARAFQNYHEGSKTSVDYALELLENILDKEIKEVLLPLLEERPLDEKALVCKKILKNML